jgi:hypothetical protein
VGVAASERFKHLDLYAHAADPTDLTDARARRYINYGL